jgi:hypothetical protein
MIKTLQITLSEETNKYMAKSSREFLPLTQNPGFVSINPGDVKK